MPYRRRIVSVSKCSPRIWTTRTGRSRRAVGRPIHVKKQDKPSLEYVLAVQHEYIEELMRCALASRRRAFR